MNSVSENMKQKEQKKREFLDLFEKNENQKEIERITYDDILYGTEIYEKILDLPDEMAVTQYITSVRQTAKQYKLTADFDSRVKPYREKALKQIKESEKEQQDYTNQNFPEWWDGFAVNEDVFCSEYLQSHKLYCINGFFYDIDGEYSISELSQDIYKIIVPYVTKNVADRTKRLVEAMKIKCWRDAPKTDESRIHLQNGTLVFDNEKFVFRNEKVFTMNRISAEYIPNAPKPEQWIKFLNQLLDENDILTLQEYMGYLLIPSTRSQKMLMIIGNGGEGKSRVGKVLHEIMGIRNAVSGSVASLDNGNSARFNKVKLIGRLCMIDDDMDMSALEKTDFLKQLISAETPLEIEPKGSTSFQSYLYTRIIAFGNNTISALYDRSYGFFRRQIILTAKEIQKGRKNDKHLTEKLLSEKCGILNWCIEGLERLIANDFEFTISEQTKQNLINSERESNNIIPFMESEHNFKYEANAEIHSQELYWAYESWCRLNNLDSLSRRTFANYVIGNCKKYGIRYKENAVNEYGKRARGFVGMKYTYHPPQIAY